MSDYKKTRTYTARLGWAYQAQAAGTPINSDTATNSRAVRNRQFIGAVVYNHHNSTQPFTVSLTLTNGTVSRTLDRTVIQTGDSAVWTEEEYGFDMDSDQYVLITVAESASYSNPDKLDVATRVRDSFK